MDTEPAGGRTRGRPREVVRRPPGEGTPLQMRAADYPPTTRAILDAAHRVLLRGGTRALTLAAVAREAHVDVTTVSYHFVTRNGLIEALMDRLYTDSVADFADAARDQSELAARWHTFIEGVRRNCSDADATQAYFDIAALALRDPVLRQRLARLNNWTIDAYADVMEPPAVGPNRALAELIFAAVDGVELHQAMAGSEYPLDEVLNLLERIVLAAFEAP